MPCYDSFFTVIFPSPDSFAASKASLQEQETEIEVDEVFWKTRIEPILRELEKGKTTVLVLNQNFAFICCSPLPPYFQCTLTIVSVAMLKTCRVFAYPVNLYSKYYANQIVSE